MDKNQIIETLLVWNFWDKKINTGIPREQYLSLLERYLLTDEIVVLTGVRRCGKSTILLQALSELIRKGAPKDNTLYINLEDPKFYRFLNLELLDKIWEAYIEYLKPQGRVYLVLDEVQKIAGWEHWVRARYDRKENIKIFVTGSNAELLSGEFSKVLTGRHLEAQILPLNFKEYLEFKGIQPRKDKLWLVKNKDKLSSEAQAYLKNGGFPKIALTQDELLRRELLGQYFNDIITKDIVDRYKLKDINKIKNLALFYAANFTRKITFHKIKKIADFSLSLDSIHRFSAYLEHSFLIDFVPRFSYSLKNQMQTDRKAYFIDNGLRQAVAFKFSADAGKLLENAVFHHLKRDRKEIYYFSEKQEVDFVCKEGIKISEVINACYNLDDKETYLREINGLCEALRYFKLKRGTIITASGERKDVREAGYQISIVPFHLWAI